MRLETDAETGTIMLSELYGGIGVKTDDGLYGVAQRDSGIEVMLNGELLASFSQGGDVKVWTKGPLTDALAAVDEQVENEGLWFAAQTAPEAYLQQELRRLHHLIRGKGRGRMNLERDIAYWAQYWYDEWRDQVHMQGDPMPPPWVEIGFKQQAALVCTMSTVLERLEHTEEGS